MSRQAVAPYKQGDVRSEAASRLTAGPGGQRTTVYAPDALSVLYELASSPATADDALALLHELQVHQVELDLQAEELRESRVELETALRRQIELYDLQPVGCFTIDRAGVLQELNLTGAAMLGIDRDKGVGVPLEGFLDPHCCGALHELIGELDDSHPVASSILQLASASAADAARTVNVHVRRDPAGPSFLVVLVPTDASIDREAPAGASR